MSSEYNYELNSIGNFFVPGTDINSLNAQHVIVELLEQAIAIANIAAEKNFNDRTMYNLLNSIEQKLILANEAIPIAFEWDKPTTKNKGE